MITFDLELERPQGIKNVVVTYTVARDELSIDSVCDNGGVPVGTTFAENRLIEDKAHEHAAREGIYNQ